MFDAVVRTNQAPIKVPSCFLYFSSGFLFDTLGYVGAAQGYAQHVGTKTTFRLINRSIAKMYQRAMSKWKRKKKNPADETPAVGGATARKILQQPQGDVRVHQPGLSFFLSLEFRHALQIPV
jgi:hypothetical protein